MQKCRFSHLFLSLKQRKLTSTPLINFIKSTLAPTKTQLPTQTFESQTVTDPKTKAGNCLLFTAKSNSLYSDYRQKQCCEAQTFLSIDSTDKLQISTQQCPTWLSAKSISNLTLFHEYSHDHQVSISFNQYTPLFTPEFYSYLK